MSYSQYDYIERQRRASDALRMAKMHQLQNQLMDDTNAEIDAREMAEIYRTNPQRFTEIMKLRAEIEQAGMDAYSAEMNDDAIDAEVVETKPIQKRLPFGGLFG
ncbi:hypothetical protein [Chroococcidiopsis sp.]|uniref:hypothetical protein n=1 Tax=Chroococcidiopsis sp. TaxID=3088168 RepID=UPI003F2D3F87